MILFYSFFIDLLPPFLERFREASRLHFVMVIQKKNLHVSKTNLLASFLWYYLLIWLHMCVRWFFRLYPDCFEITDSFFITADAWTSLSSPSFFFLKLYKPKNRVCRNWLYIKITDLVRTMQLLQYNGSKPFFAFIGILFM